MNNIIHLPQRLLPTQALYEKQYNRLLECCELDSDTPGRVNSFGYAACVGVTELWKAAYRAAGMGRV